MSLLLGVVLALAVSVRIPSTCTLYDSRAPSRGRRTSVRRSWPRTSSRVPTATGSPCAPFPSTVPAGEHTPSIFTAHCHPSASVPIVLSSYEPPTNGHRARVSLRSNHQRENLDRRHWTTFGTGLRNGQRTTDSEPLAFFFCHEHAVQWARSRVQGYARFRKLWRCGRWYGSSRVQYCGGCIDVDIFAWSVAYYCNMIP